MSNDNYSSSGPPNSGYIKRMGSNINEDYIPEESPPSFPAGGMQNSFQHQEYQIGAREVPTGSDESHVSTGPGSISDLRRFQPSLNNMDNRNSVVGTIGEAPTIEGNVHNGSKIELGSEAQYGDKKAPGHSSLGHENENHSKPSGGEASSADDEINQADYIGISLVGKKFKEVNPTAYYVEKDDDLNQSM